MPRSVVAHCRSVGRTQHFLLMIVIIQMEEQNERDEEIKTVRVANFSKFKFSLQIGQDFCRRPMLGSPGHISYYTLNYSQFSPENFDFFGTPSYWYFLISSVQWQFLTRRKKPHAISINTERVRSPRVQTFWWHSSNWDVRTGDFQPYRPGSMLLEKVAAKMDQNS